jgi:uncharacterized protein involved in outer membrane biogenesis
VIRRRTLFLAIAACLGLALTGLSVYLAVSDLAEWRDTVARLASQALGRRLVIGGDFGVEVGRVTRVTATEVALANAGWGSEPEMASVDRLAVEIDLWSLVAGPLRLPSVEIEGGRAVFERGPDGRSNWALGAGAGGPARGPVELRVDRVRAAGVELRFGGPGDRPPIDLVLGSLVSDGDSRGMHRLSADGRLAGREVAVAGRVGPFTGIVNTSRVEAELTGLVDGAELALGGSIGDLGRLTGLDLVATATIPDLDRLTGILGRPDGAIGAVELRVTASSTGPLTTLSGLATAAGGEARVDGTVDSLISPGDLDLAIAIAGHDVGGIAALAGLGSVEPRPFEIRGGVRWRGFPLELDNLEVTVGESRLTANGRLGEPPLLLETDLVVDGAGPDLGGIAAALGIEAPAVPFTVSGRLARAEGGVRVESVRLAVGEAELAVDGFIGDPPACRGTELAVGAHGPDLGSVVSLTGLELPRAPFTLDGRLVEGDGAVDLREVTASVGSHRLSVAGRLTPEAGMVGADLEIVADGEELSELGAAIGQSGLPSTPYHVEGGIAVTPEGVGLRALRGRLPDLGLDLEVDGIVVRAPELVGTRLDVATSGDDLSALAWLADPVELPSEPFRAAGEIEAVAGGWRLGDVVLTLGGNRVAGDATLLRAPGLAGSIFDLELEGPDLDAAGRLAAAAIGRAWPALPALPYALSGSLEVDDGRLVLRGGSATVGDATITADGQVGLLRGGEGTDLEIAADLPEASILAPLLDRPLPAEPLRAAGRVRVGASGYVLERLHVSLGGNRLELDGLLGRAPSFAGTSLGMRATVADPSLLRILGGADWLPGSPFTVSATLIGNDRRLRADDIDLRIGSSDVAGSVLLDRGVDHRRPRFVARLSSELIVWSDLLHRPDPPEGGEASDAPAAKPKRDRVIPDGPVDVDALERLDADLAWDIAELRLALHSYRRLGVTIGLADGALEVSRLAGVGDRGGALEGSATIASRAGRVEGRLELAVRDAKLALAGPDTKPDRLCAYSGTIQLASSGATWRELATRADGAATMTLGPGDVASSVVDRITADILVSLLQALNPFSRSGGQEELECAVLHAEVHDGVVSVGPMALQTGSVTMLGEGTVDLATEKLRLDWVSKPRKGLGLSASAVTNSLIRLGGTLARPSVEVKPAEAIATTGIAVATAGLSILGKGILDRATAEKQVCEAALEEIEKKRRRPSDDVSPPPPQFDER